MPKKVKKGAQELLADIKRERNKQSKQQKDDNKKQNQKEKHKGKGNSNMARFTKQMAAIGLQIREMG